MKKIVIVGATSGIGYEVVQIYLKLGWKLGIAGRRTGLLESFKSQFPDQIEIESLDVTTVDAVDKLHELIRKLGGMDVFLLSTGIGCQNRNLDPETELATVTTNAVGFTRMVTAAFHYFKENGKGHIAVISSIAGTKGIGIAPSYSATKRFQNTYIDALAQLVNMEKLPITFTDIRPGFVKTALLKSGNYPMLMKADYVAKQIVKAIEHKKRVAVIDWRYAILVFFWKLIPRYIWERLSIHN